MAKWRVRFCDSCRNSWHVYFYRNKRKTINISDPNRPLDPAIYAHADTHTDKATQLHINLGDRACGRFVVANVFNV